MGNQFGSSSEEVNGVIAHFKKDKATVTLWTRSNKKKLREDVADGIRRGLGRSPDFKMHWYKTSCFIEGGVRKFFLV